MKILITGSKGFIGKQLMRKMPTYCLDINRHKVPIEYDLEAGNDVRDKFKLDMLFDRERFDVVINLAARAGVRRGEQYPEEYYDTNVKGLMNLIAVSEKYEVKQFIHFSSSSVYGSEGKEATKEDDPKNPKSIYGITKFIGEMLLGLSKLNYTIIRPFTVVGEGGRKDMVVYKWIEQIKKGDPISFYGGGNTSRGYTYVEDLIDGVMLCLGNKKAYRQDFNMGGKQSICLKELGDVFESECPDLQIDYQEIPKCDQKHSLADTSKAEKILGWKPKTDVIKIIRKIIKCELDL